MSREFRLERRRLGLLHEPQCPIELTGVDEREGEATCGFDHAHGVARGPTQRETLLEQRLRLLEVTLDASQAARRNERARPDVAGRRRPRQGVGENLRPSARSTRGESWYSVASRSSSSDPVSAAQPSAERMFSVSASNRKKAVVTRPVSTNFSVSGSGIASAKYAACRLRRASWSGRLRSFSAANSWIVSSIE